MITQTKWQLTQISVFLSVPACAHTYIYALCPSLHTHAFCIGLCSVQFSDFALMFFSLCFSLRKGGGAKVLKATLQTALAKTLASVFSRCTLLREGAAARVMWLLVVCPDKQAVHNL